jgi:ribosomal protein S19
VLCGLAADWALTEQLIEDDAKDSKHAAAIRTMGRRRMTILPELTSR